MVWMVFYVFLMLMIVLELVEGNLVYGDMVLKFFEYFIGIVVVMNLLNGMGLWDEEDGFYYDYFNVNGKLILFKICFLVGFILMIIVIVFWDD